MPACHIFTFLTGKRGIVDDKVHGYGRLGDFLERNRLRIVRRAERIADMDVRDAGNRHDGTDPGLRHFYLV